MRGPYSTPITPLTGSLFHADPQPWLLESGGAKLWTSRHFAASDDSLAHELDDPDYRAAVLTGRTQALNEITDLINALALNVEPEHGPEVTLGTLVGNWLEVVAWLSQAEQEASDELALLATLQGERTGR